MTELRVERFSNPAFLTHVGAGDDVPASGWAIRFDGDVFFDGEHVGRSGKYMFDRDFDFMAKYTARRTKLQANVAQNNSICEPTSP